MVRVCSPCTPNDKLLIDSTFEEKGMTLENCKSECWKRKQCKGLVHFPPVQGNNTLQRCVLHAEAKTYTTYTNTNPYPYTPSVYKKGFNRNYILAIVLRLIISDFNIQNINFYLLYIQFMI